MAAIERIAHFRLLGRLGAGGMGVVYRARDEKLERDVAIKVIHAEHGSDSEYRRRFLREAKAAAAVVHPGVATVYEVGEDGDAMYIAMELIAGRTLREALGEIAPSRALEVAAAIADALGKAHDAGIVHRDIKPENVLLTDDGGVKVLDFGIARRSIDPSEPARGEDPTEMLSREGVVIGTAGYMSPEQILAKDVGPPSDIFSLGVVLYEMLAKRRPFGGASLIESAIAATRDEPAPLAEQAALPREVTALVHKCLEKDPAARPPKASELGARLRDLANDVGTVSEAKTMLATATKPPENPPPRARSRPIWALGLAAALLGGALWLGARALRNGGAEPVAPASATVTASAPPPAPTAVAITELPVTGTDNPEALAAYKSAMSAFRRADWHRAELHLRDAVAKDPDFALAQLRLAHCEGHTGDASEARKRFQWLAEHESMLDERNRAWLHAVEALQVHEPADYALATKIFEDASRSWPADAELHYMVAATRTRARRVEGALEEARTAVALDPEYADALQLIGRALLLQGDVDQASKYFERCIAARSTDCMHDRLRLRARVGHCQEAIADAKLYDESGGGGALHWVYAASALLSDGEGFEAAEKFLALAEGKGGNEPTRWVVRVARLRMLALRGRFDELRAEIERTYPEATRFEELADLTVLGVMAALESGDDTGATEAAERFLGDRHVAVAGFAELPSQDPTPWLWSLLERSRRLSQSDVTTKLERWRSGVRAVGFDEGSIWFQSAALPAATAGEARAALASQPKGFAVEEVQDAQLGWDTLGELARLSGDSDAATKHLGRAEASCTMLLYPFGHLRGEGALGETLESSDKARACAAYTRVLRFWANAQPRSITAERAREQSKALSCKGS